MDKKRYEQEKQVLTEMIDLLKLRIKEMKGEAPAYEEMLEGLEWERKTVKERLKDLKINENNT